MANKAVESTSKGKGCGPATFLIFILIVAGIILGINEGIGVYGVNCGDTPIIKCLDEIFSEDEADEKVTVTATGPYSYDDYSITMTMKIPLGGGGVTGTVAGSCGGKLTGSYNGQDKGGISGRFAGSCRVFGVNVPSSATWGGVVNKDSKTVPISFDGSGGGFSHQDSMSLSY